MAKKSKLRIRIETIAAYCIAAVPLVLILTWRAGLLQDLETRFEGHWIEPLVQLMKQ
jgi:hypothetical protein